MNERYGRVYKPRGIFRRIAKALLILALALVVLFGYLYINWQNYIVYTHSGLYLDLPFMDNEGRGSSPGNSSSGGSVSDSLTGGAGDEDEAGTGEPGEEPSEAEDGSTQQVSDDAAGSESDAAQSADAEGSDDTAADTDTAADPDENAQEPGENTDEPAVPEPGDDAAESEEDSKPDNGVKDSFT